MPTRWHNLRNLAVTRASGSRWVSSEGQNCAKREEGRSMPDPDTRVMTRFLPHRPTTADAEVRRRGFTLTELLIVIVLIVILLGIAIPTLSVLTGTRSTESARNQLAAMLGRARGLAITQQANIGVAIFVDSTGRTNMALVQLYSDLIGPQSYQAWTYYDPAAYPAFNPVGGVATAVNYQVGDVVFRLAAFLKAAYNDNVPTEPLGLAYPGVQKKTVKTFVCIQNHTAATTNEPGTAGGQNYWQLLLPNSIDVIQGDVEQLPKGVGVELINDTASSPNTSNQSDQYVHTGVILFDSTGKLLVSPFIIGPGSTLGNLIGLVSPTMIPTFNVNQPNQMLSEIGVALYDLTNLQDQPFYTTNTVAQSADLTIQTNSNPPQVPPPLATKSAQDNWISANAQILFVDRTSGAVQKAE